jgi:hypothetical protein
VVLNSGGKKKKKKKEKKEKKSAHADGLIDLYQKFIYIKEIILIQI